MPRGAWLSEGKFTNAFNKERYFSYRFFHDKIMAYIGFEVIAINVVKGVIIHPALSATELQRQMNDIGVDPRGVAIMTPKLQHFTMRVFGINQRQAAIIKQEMLARGAEAAVSWQACSWDGQPADLSGSLLLGGTLRQLQQFIVKLGMQPFGLPELADKLAVALDNYDGTNRKSITIAGKSYDWQAKTYVMGIINLTPDSFSADGLYRENDYIAAAVQRAEQMVADGADLLDIGAESTRPGGGAVEQAEEERRLLPALKELAAAVKVPLSVDTYKPEVAEKALNLGAAIINDIWGLKSPADRTGRMAKLVAESKAPVVVMHNQERTGYKHRMREIIDSLADSMELALRAGADFEQLIVDPGVGFAKDYQDNLVVLNDLDQLKVLGAPILLGTSRKSVIGLTLDLPVAERLEGSLAAAVWGIARGANIIRVHDVKETVRAVKICDAIRWAI